VDKRIQNQCVLDANGAIPETYLLPGGDVRWQGLTLVGGDLTVLCTDFGSSAPNRRDPAYPPGLIAPSGECHDPPVQDLFDIRGKVALVTGAVIPVDGGISTRHG
jgi:hypothetical protein